MRAGYEVPPLMFIRAEVAALVAGARMVRAWGGAELARAAEEALVKIGAVLPESLRASAENVPIHAFAFMDLDPVDRAMLDRLEVACNARTKLAIVYTDEDGAETRRKVRPLALHFWGRTWTLAAWCELRQGLRTFRADRIGAAEDAGTFRAERDKSLAASYAAHGAGAARSADVGRTRRASGQTGTRSGRVAPGLEPPRRRPVWGETMRLP